MANDLEDFQNLLDNTEPCYVEYKDDGTLNDPELWVGTWTNHIEPETAAELCAGCHVLEQCLAYALANNEKTGVWGGTSPEQRKEILRERKKNGIG